MKPLCGGRTRIVHRCVQHPFCINRSMTLHINNLRFSSFLKWVDPVLFWIAGFAGVTAVMGGKNWYQTICMSTLLMLWIHLYVRIRRYNRPHSPDTRATLKVSTSPNVDWEAVAFRGNVLHSGRGSQTIQVSSTSTYIDRARKYKYSEFVYEVSVSSGNGDAFAALMVDDDDEVLQTVVCSRAGEPQLIYTDLITAYGTKHWLIPGFLQGIPR